MPDHIQRHRITCLIRRVRRIRHDRTFTGSYADTIASVPGLSLLIDHIDQDITAKCNGASAITHFIRVLRSIQLKVCPRGIGRAQQQMLFEMTMGALPAIVGIEQYNTDPVCFHDEMRRNNFWVDVSLDDQDSTDHDTSTARNFFVFLQCPRQVGKSTAARLFLASILVARPKIILVTLAQNLVLSRENVAKIKDMLLAADVAFHRSSAERLILANGSVLSANASIRGLSPHGIYADEIAFMDTEVVTKGIIPITQNAGVFCLATTTPNQDNEMTRVFVEELRAYMRIVNICMVCPACMQLGEDEAALCCHRLFITPPWRGDPLRAANIRAILQAADSQGYAQEMLNVVSGGPTAAFPIDRLKVLRSALQNPANPLRVDITNQPRGWLVNDSILIGVDPNYRGTRDAFVLTALGIMAYAGNTPIYLGHAISVTSICMDASFKAFVHKFLEVLMTTIPHVTTIITAIEPNQMGATQYFAQCLSVWVLSSNQQLRWPRLKIVHVMHSSTNKDHQQMAAVRHETRPKLLLGIPAPSLQNKQDYHKVARAILDTERLCVAHPMAVLRRQGQLLTNAMTEAWNQFIEQMANYKKIVTHIHNNVRYSGKETGCRRDDLVMGFMIALYFALEMLVNPYSQVQVSEIPRDVLFMQDDPVLAATAAEQAAAAADLVRRTELAAKRAKAGRQY
jgi:hypothetical protein